MLHSRTARRTPASAGSFSAWVGASGEALWLISIPPNEHERSEDRGMTPRSFRAVTAGRSLLTRGGQRQLVLVLGVFDLRAADQALHFLVHRFLAQRLADVVLALLERRGRLHP